MQLNSEKVLQKLWCPICKQGELQENNHFIHCTHCGLRLTKGNEVTLDILCCRLADVHAEHLDRGCRLKPKFCVERRFNITALYISCEGCNTFEVVGGVRTGSWWMLPEADGIPFRNILLCIKVL